MGNFFGRYERNLDERNRLQLPSKLFSDALPKSFFALRGFDGCLAIYEKEAFDDLLQDLKDKSYLLKDSRDFIRLTLESVREFEVDAHERITIPKDLAERYKISSSVVVLGVIDHFEIWDKASYDEYAAERSASYEGIAEKMGGKNNG